MNTDKNELIPTENAQRIADYLKQYGSITEVTVANDSQYQNAIDKRYELNDALKKLEADRKELVKPYNDAQKEINSRYKTVTDLLKNGVQVIGSALGKWASEQEAKRIEEQRKRDAEAAEMRRKAEEKAAAERQKAAKYEEEGKAALAAKALARADTQESIADMTVPDIVPSKTAAPGLHFRDKTECVIVDLEAAVKECLVNPFLNDAIQIDTQMLCKLYDATKGSIKIAGVEFTVRKVPYQRGR